MNGKLGWWTLAAAGLALAAATPCFATTASSEEATAVASPAASAAPCPALNLFGSLEAILQLPGPEAVEAIPIAGRAPGFRTCVCSCGYPCRTDADCGPGGRCGAGITCCARPAPGQRPDTSVERLPAEVPVGP
jgi:hypothetical protein